MNARRTHRRLGVTLAASVLVACASAPAPSVRQEIRADANPPERVAQTVTSFTPALRCMDDLMFRLGTRDVTLMMEDLRDATQRVPVGTRDMMTSAISEMTRRSRAARLSVIGGDQANLLQALQQAQKTSAFGVVPEFNIRGSISQFDEDVRQQGGSFGLAVERAFGFRLGTETKFSVMAFDAAVVQTASLTLLPGVVSKNTTVIARQNASASDGQARILGAAAVFSFSAARAEGNAQAARNMVELAAIELIGKLIRAPYWQCLGTPDGHHEVQREIDDWFLAMQPEELVVFVKERLRERRYFDGALDGAGGPAFTTALNAYRSQLDLPGDGAMDVEFFRRFIVSQVPNGPLARPATRSAAVTAPASAPVSSAAAPAPAAAALPEPAPAGVATPAAADIAPIRMLAGSAREGRVSLKVVADQAGYVYCYAQDPKSGAIRRIFPNRFVRDPRVEAAGAITLPGAARFMLVEAHQFACVHAPREVYNDLPPPLRWGDFEDIRLASFEEIRKRFQEASGVPVTLARPLVP